MHRGTWGTLLSLALLACSESATERGDRLARARRFTEAVAAYKEAIDRYPHDYDAAFGIARIYCHEMHMPKKCLAWTDKLLEAYPGRREYREAAAAGWTDEAAEARTRGEEAEAKRAEAKAAELRRP